MSNIVLYRHPVSGHSHRVELLLSLLKLEVEIITVDLKAGTHKLPAFLIKNPLGQVPVLEDDGVILPDSNAILIYLAHRYDSLRSWLPNDSILAAQVQRFLSFASGPIASGPARARLITLFGANYDAELTIEESHKILKVIDEHLTGKNWLVGSTVTIADIANYAYIAHAPEGNVDIYSYKNIKTWLSRIEMLDGFLPFGKSSVGMAA